MLEGFRPNPSVVSDFGGRAERICRSVPYWSSFSCTRSSNVGRSDSVHERRELPWSGHRVEDFDRRAHSSSEKTYT